MHLSDTPSLNHRIYCGVAPPLAALTASTLLIRLSTRFRSLVEGILDHFSRTAFVRSDTDVSNSSLKCCIWLGAALCARLSSSSTPNWLIHVFMNLDLSPNYSHKVGGMKLFKMSWYAETFRVPFTGTEGLSPIPKKQPHSAIPPLHQTLHLVQCSHTGNC